MLQERKLELKKYIREREIQLFAMKDCLNLTNMYNARDYDAFKSYVNGLRDAMKILNRSDECGKK